MITVKLFALLKDKAGCSEIRVSFRGGTVADLLQLIAKSYPLLSDFVSPDRIMVSVNQEFVKQDASVHVGDEVALMPPFSGGSGPAGQVRRESVNTISPVWEGTHA